MSKPFDYLMLAVEIGGSRKYRRLTPPERWATVAGVFSLAAKSPESGALLITWGEEVTPTDVAEQAGVSVSVACSALEKLKKLGELVRDEQLGAWVLEDWTRHQPAPKRKKPSDSAEATRERKRRSRANVTPSHARDTQDVTPHVTPDVTRSLSREEKRREENYPQTPVTGGGVKVKFSGKVVPKNVLETALAVLEDFNVREGTGYKPFGAGEKPTDEFKRIIGALLERPEVTRDLALRVNEVGLTANRFWDGPAQPGNVWGPGVRGRNIEQALRPGAVTAQHAPLGNTAGDDFTARMNSRRGSQA